MRKIKTLKKNYEFKNVLNKGKFYLGKQIIIYISKNKATVVKRIVIIGNQFWLVIIYEINPVAEIEFKIIFNSFITLAFFSKISTHFWCVVYVQTNLP